MIIRPDVTPGRKGLERARSRAPLLIAYLLLPVIAGCGGKPVGNVSGKVTFNGAPLAFGTIAFVGQGGRSVSTGMIAFGDYTVAKLPVGATAVTVEAHPIPPQMGNPFQGSVPKGPPAPPPTFVEIPARYGDEKQSGLTYTVVAGNQTHDIALTP